MDDANLFFLAYDSVDDIRGLDVWRVDKATHEQEKLASLPLQVRDRELAIDDTYIYYARYDSSWLGPTRVFKLPRTGGASVQIAHADADVSALTVDRGQAFFIAGARAHRRGKLVSVDVATGEQSIVAADIDGYSIGPDTVYWTRDKQLFESLRAGGEAKQSEFLWTPAQIDNWIGGVRHDRDTVWWWDDDDALHRAPKHGGPSQVILYEDGDEAFAYEVVGDTVYWTHSGGALWGMPLGAKPDEAVLLDRRGNYDDDDYPSVLLVDGNTVYWQAGPDLDRRASDEDPLALYYYCGT